MLPNDVATMCVNLIRAQGLSPMEEIVTGAAIITQLAQGAGTLVHVPVVRNTTGTVERVESLRPIQTPTNIPPPQNRGPAIAEPGYACVCISCGKQAYRVVSPVYGRGMQADEFFSAFEPVGHDKRLAPPFEFENDGDVMITDCRLCGAPLALVLSGNLTKAHNLYNKIHGSQGKATTKGDVYAGSVGAGEVGVE